MGLATVRALLDAGYRVAATDLRTDQVGALAKEHGDCLACFVMDVSDHAAVHADCDQIEARFGRIDVCVNTAGFCNTPIAKRPRQSCGTRPCVSTSTAYFLSASGSRPA